MSIKSIKARQIFDSRGNPTVEVDLVTAKGNRRLGLTLVELPDLLLTLSTAVISKTFSLPRGGGGGRHAHIHLHMLQTLQCDCFKTCENDLLWALFISSHTGSFSGTSETWGKDGNVYFAILNVS